jgi:hypothetical protein
MCSYWCYTITNDEDKNGGNKDGDGNKDKESGAVETAEEAG